MQVGCGATRQTGIEAASHLGLAMHAGIGAFPTVQGANVEKELTHAPIPEAHADEPPVGATTTADPSGQAAEAVATGLVVATHT